MIIILYNEEDSTVMDMEEIPTGENVNAGADFVKWETGGLENLALPFLLLNEDPGLERGDKVPVELFDTDKTETHWKMDPQKELAELRQRLQNTEEVLDFLLEI